MTPPTKEEKDYCCEKCGQWFGRRDMCLDKSCSCHSILKECHHNLVEKTAGFCDCFPNERCKEDWTEKPYTSDHVWNADHHNLPSGNCIKCGYSNREWRKKLESTIENFGKISVAPKEGEWEEEFDETFEASFEYGPSRKEAKEFIRKLISSTEERVREEERKKCLNHPNTINTQV